MNSTQRLPPQNLGAEQAILGSIMLDNDLIDKTLLSPADFYRRSHHYIFEVMLALRKEGQRIDVITISEKLSAQNQLDHVGGMPYILEIFDAIPTTAGFRSYVELIRKKAAYRRLITELTSAFNGAYNEQGDPFERLIALGVKDYVGGGSDMFPRSFVDYPTTGSVRCVTSGIAALDNKHGGFKGLSVVSGKTGVNKSTLVLQAALHWAGAGNPVCYWDGEMGKARMSRRIGKEPPASFFYEANYNRMTPTMVAHTVRKHAQGEALLLFVVDDLQLLINNFDDRRRCVDEWIGLMVQLKRTYPVVFLVVSKLAGGIRGQEKESGDIRYNADMVYKLEAAGKTCKRTLICEKDRDNPVGHLGGLEVSSFDGCLRLVEG